MSKKACETFIQTLSVIIFHQKCFNKLCPSLNNWCMATSGFLHDRCPRGHVTPTTSSIASRWWRRGSGKAAGSQRYDEKDGRNEGEQCSSRLQHRSVRIAGLASDCYSCYQTNGCTHKHITTPQQTDLHLCLIWKPTQAYSTNRCHSFEFWWLENRWTLSSTCKFECFLFCSP